jgi:Zn-dependent protease/predicted transcriptional regulator
MQWSYNLGKIFGIQFRIHVTFLMLLVFIFISGLFERGFDEAVTAVLFICAVFACVLIHEIGHSLIARRFGKEAKSITLLPIGGVATMEEIPEKPSQEIAIAIIGPFINLAIAALLYLFAERWTGVFVPNLYPESVSAFFSGLIGVNIMLAFFNLLPAFPMDGGRVLRGLLALKMEYVKATATAVFIGQGISLLFIFYGIFFNWWLALIGLFLYMGAGGENRHVMLRSVLKQIPVEDAMTTEYHSMRPDEPLSKALEHVFHGCQHDFPVVGDKGIEGILTRNQIIAAIHEKGIAMPISEVMDRNFGYINPHAPLDVVYQQLLASHKTAMAVTEGSQLKGILSLDSISRYLMIQSALKGK